MFLASAPHQPLRSGAGELTLSVVPAAVWPAATLFEAVPKQLLSGAVHDFLVIPRDAYGNSGASGAVVRVKATQAGDEEAKACAVAREDRTGAYTARLALTRAGAAALRVWVQHDADASATGIVPHPASLAHARHSLWCRFFAEQPDPAWGHASRRRRRREQRAAAGHERHGACMCCELGLRQAGL